MYYFIFDERLQKESHSIADIQFSDFIFTYHKIFWEDEPDPSSINSDPYKKALLMIITHKKTSYNASLLLREWLPKKARLNSFSRGFIDDVIFIDDSSNEDVSNAGYKTLWPDEEIIQKGLRANRRWKYRGMIPLKEIAKVAKLKVGFDYFLQQTELPWLKYQDDDTYLIFENFAKMMNDYSNAHPFPQAFNDSIIKGCCTTDKFENYFQGGTGLLMSRNAVESFVKYWENFYYSFNTFEDRAVIQLVFKAGVNLEALSSTYFIGDGFKSSFNDFLKNSNFTDLPKCPKNHPFTKCAKEFYYLNKVASVHKLDTYNPSIAAMIRSGAITDNVRFYHNDWSPSLCYMD